MNYTCLSKYNMALFDMIILYTFQACVAHMKMTVFLDVVPCSVIEIDLRFRGAYYFHHQGDDVSSKHLWNIGQFVPGYMV
jgi:hypothetical protein